MFPDEVELFPKSYRNMYLNRLVDKYLSHTLFYQRQPPQSHIQSQGKDKSRCRNLIPINATKLSGSLFVGLLQDFKLSQIYLGNFYYTYKNDYQKALATLIEVDSSMRKYAFLSGTWNRFSSPVNGSSCLMMKSKLCLAFLVLTGYLSSGPIELSSRCARFTLFATLRFVAS